MPPVYQAGVNRALDDVITAAQWNSYLGVDGSNDYFKEKVDLRDDISVTTPAKAIETVYQNTSGKLLFVTVSLRLTYDGGTSSATVKIEAANPPTVIRAQVSAISGTHADRIAVSFFVPLNWYYAIYKSGGSGTDPIADYWTEWELF